MLGCCGILGELSGLKKSDESFTDNRTDRTRLISKESCPVLGIFEFTVWLLSEICTSYHAFVSCCVWSLHLYFLEAEISRNL